MKLKTLLIHPIKLGAVYIILTIACLLFFWLTPIRMEVFDQWWLSVIGAHSIPLFLGWALYGINEMENN